MSISDGSPSMYQSVHGLLCGSIYIVGKRLESFKRVQNA